MGAKNMVIAGDYLNKGVMKFGVTAQINTSLKESLVLNKATVDSYEVVTEEHSKSASSGVARGLVGGVLLGPVGLLAGGISAKNKGAYTVAIAFKDGKRSLAEIDEKIYKALVASMF
ncbi:conserved hypothetical protein [uncultured Eubacteriales bacterium]|uniref:Uncharacterized protein n=1 Tax=uncultured Eubacteriales bacterium TaxID=172733 RepID=A0A212J4J7_9FIRM|nr:conserved hypothetical protein [uncultured Eubacteriales bacterium]